MKTLTILSTSYNRNNDLNRLIKSVYKYVNFNDVKFVIFKYDNLSLELLSKANVEIEVINDKLNTGKTYNILNYIKNNINNSKYFMVIDDKDYFVHNFLPIINFLRINNNNLLTFNMKYINHPNGLNGPSKFIENKSILKNYFRMINRSYGDRLWIASSRNFSSIEIKDFYGKEISIQGYLYNRFYAKVNCNNLFGDINFVTRHYSNDGYSNDKENKWLKLSPNSELYEKQLFFKDIKNPLFKIYYLMKFNKEYLQVIHIKNELDDVNIRFKKKTSWVYKLLFFLKPFIN